MEKGLTSLVERLSHTLGSICFLRKLNIYLPCDVVITSRRFPTRKGNVCPHKDFHMNVNGSFIFNRQKLETAQMPISR